MVRSQLTTRVTDRFTRSLLLCFAVSLVVGLSFAGVAGAQVTADTLEPNDNRESATDVGSGDSYDGLSIHDSTDDDYFAVTVSAGETVTADIDFDHDDGDIDLELLSPTGEELDGSYSTSDGESVSHTAGESGTYYVYVYGFSGDTAPYDIDIDTEEGSEDTQSGDGLEPNDDRSSATDLGSGGSYTGLTVNSDTDDDYFAVDADAGDRITADISFDHDGGDIDLELLGPNGAELEDSISTTDDESISYTVSESGTYYVNVYAYSGAPNSYDISVDTAESDEVQDGADLRAISVGETAQGTIDRSDPTVDGYLHEPVTFDGQQGDAVTISMTSETGDTYLVLQGPNGEFVTSDDDGGTGLNSEIEGYTLPQTGEYTIIATSYSEDATFDYTLTVEEAPSGPAQGEADPLEPNDRIESATDLGSGGSYSGLTVTQDDSDYFAVTADEGETITAEISFAHAEGDIDMALLGPAGEELEGAASVSDDERISYTAAESGTYYVEVYDFSGAPNSYDISVETSGSQSSGDIALQGNATAAADGTMLVQFDLRNTGEAPRAVILQAGEGVDSLGTGFAVADHEDDGGSWRATEGSWLFSDLGPGESVSPTVAVEVPEDAEGTRLLPVTAETERGTVTTTVELELGEIGIVEAADTNDDGELDDGEILAAIEAWRTDSTIEGTDTTVSDDQIIDLISTWRSEGR